MAKRDYYQVLGVAKNAGEADIKKAYRRLAMKFHPDRNPGDKEAEEKFKEAKESYEILSDTQKRATYDQFGHAGIDAARQGGAPGGAGGFHPGDAFGDIFGDVFGDILGSGRRGGGRSQVFRGADLRYELELDLHGAVFGKSVEIEIPKLAECETCHGSGAAKGSTPVTCDTCSGSGQVRISQGFFQLQQTCPKCRGSGKIIKNPCDTCLGQGRVRRVKKLSVKVPAGVDTGDRIRLGGEGEAGRNGGPPGDLYVEVAVKDHPIFERDGAHLSCEAPIGFATAALGGAVDVPTLDGHVSLKIPAETQPGRAFRLRDKGGKPVNLTAEQRELVKQLDESLQKGGTRHTPREKSFFEGVKSFFTGDA